MTSYIHDVTVNRKTISKTDLARELGTESSSPNYFYTLQQLKTQGYLHESDMKTLRLRKNAFVEKEIPFVTTDDGQQKDDPAKETASANSEEENTRRCFYPVIPAVYYSFTQCHCRSTLYIKPYKTNQRLRYVSSPGQRFWSCAHEWPTLSATRLLVISRSCCYMMSSKGGLKASKFIPCSETFSFLAGLGASGVVGN